MFEVFTFFCSHQNMTCSRRRENLYSSLYLPALGLGSLVGRLEGRRFVWAVPVAMALLGIAEQNRHLAYPLLHRDLTPPRVYAEIAKVGGGLIELPIGVSKISIAYQPVHGQPVFGGMGESASVLWPPGFNRRMSNTFIQFLRSMTRDPQQPTPYQKTAITTFKAEGFRFVVMDRQLLESTLHRRRWGANATVEERQNAAFIAQDMMIRHLGEPWAVEGRLVVWDLVGDADSPAGLEPTAEKLSARSWEAEEMPEYERHLRELGRLVDP